MINFHFQFANQYQRNKQDSIWKNLVQGSQVETHTFQQVGGGILTLAFIQNLRALIVSMDTLMKARLHFLIEPLRLLYFTHFWKEVHSLKLYCGESVAAGVSCPFSAFITELLKTETCHHFLSALYAQVHYSQRERWDSLPGKKKENKKT